MARSKTLAIPSLVFLNALYPPNPFPRKTGYSSDRFLPGAVAAEPLSARLSRSIRVTRKIVLSTPFTVRSIPGISAIVLALIPAR